MPAAAASSSAIAWSVATSTRPSRSRSPRWSMTGSNPATPIATFTSPRRKARPWVSVTTTPTLPPTAAAMRAWIRRAEASGSREQDHRALGGVRGVDPRVGADEAVVGLADHGASAPTHDPRALGEDQLAQGRVLSGLPGEGPG